MKNRRSLLQRALAVSVLGATGWPIHAAFAANTPLLALVIGNDRYQQNARLTNAGKDAELVGAALQEMGATVTRLRDASADQMRQAVTELAKRAAAQNAVAWLYYSGHGVQVNGSNYLQGVDADFSLPERVRSQGLDLSWVSEVLSRDKLPAAVVLVDACRDNPFLPASRGLDGHGLAPMEPQGQLIAFSTAPFKKALDGRQQTNGPYATALASVFKKRPVALHDALQQVAQKVYQSTAKQQVPWYSSSLRTDLILERQGVRFGAAPQAKGGATVVASADQTRSAITYRPDSPAHATGQRDAQYWTKVEQRLVTELHYATPENAKKWLSVAARPGASDDVRMLAGMVLTDGKAGVKMNKGRAVRLLLPVARSGNAFAQTLLGEAYYEQRNLGEAYRWLSIAVESGLLRAQMDLAELDLRMDLANGQVKPESLKAMGRSAVDTLNGIQHWQQGLTVPAPK